MSKFFNRNWKAGFTLVELIVVIAILAILAGIAIPVYSGYIAKANLAADYVLLDAANQALAAASLEHGVDTDKLAVELKLDDEHKIEGIENVSGSLDGFIVSPIRAEIPDAAYVLAPLSSHRAVALAVTPEQAKDALEDSFMKYFGENANVPLKELWKQQTIILTNGAVITLGEISSDGETVTMTFTRDGKTASLNITKTQAEALKKSTFGANMTMGELMGDISKMTNSLAGILGGGNFVASLIGEDTLASLGVERDANGHYNNTELSNAVVVAMAQMLGTGEGLDQQMSTVMSNAGQIGQIKAVMQMPKNQILNALMADNMAGLQGVLAMYATATGFASSDAANGENKWTYTDPDTGKTYTAQEYYNNVNSNIEKISARYAAMESSNPVDAAAEIMSEMSKLSNLMLNADGTFNTQYNAYASKGSNEKSQLELDATGFIQSMSAIKDNQSALATAGAISDGFDSAAIESLLGMIYGYDFSQGN